MNLDELQDAIVDELRPHVQRMAGRHPQFVARVLKRLVQRVPDFDPAPYWRNEADREDFVAAVAIDVIDEPAPAAEAVWVTILLTVLLPALIRAFLLWLQASDSHYLSARVLRDELARNQTRSIEPSRDTRPHGRSFLILTVVGLLLTILLLAAIANAAPVHEIGNPERRETELCKELVPRLNQERGGKWETEHRLWDGTRVDLLSDEYAVEVDYAGKWAKCIGQALYYGHVTDRQPVCLLLAAGTTENHFVYRCQTVCEAHGIQLWVVQIDANGDLKK